MSEHPPFALDVPNLMPSGSCPVTDHIPKARIVAAYRSYAPLYDWLFGAVYAHGRRGLAAAVNALAPQNLLEVGVGTGLMLPSYPASSTVVGIDVCDKMLERAQTKASSLPGRSIQLHAMDAEQMNFPDGAFDCVTLPYVLSVTSDPKRLVSELRRVCRKDGTIIVLNHFSGSRFWWLAERTVRRIADRVGFRSDFSYEDHILAYDWHVESVADVNLFGLSRLVVIRNV